MSAGTATAPCNDCEDDPCSGCTEANCDYCSLLLKNADTGRDNDE